MDEIDESTRTTFRAVLGRGFCEPQSHQIVGGIDAILQIPRRELPAAEELAELGLPLCFPKRELDRLGLGLEAG